MQIVSVHQTDRAWQKQIVQMRWGQPYGTVIPATERRLAAKMSQISSNKLLARVAWYFSGLICNNSGS